MSQVEISTPFINHVASGKGPYVTLVHGVGANLQSWDEVTKLLEPLFTVVRLDLRGHGKSGRITTCTLDDLASDVRDVWDARGSMQEELQVYGRGGQPCPPSGGSSS